MFRNLTPSDRLVLSFLLLANVVFAFANGEGIPEARLVHGGLFVGFGVVALLCARFDGRRWVPWLRTISTVAVLMTLYSSLAEPSFVAMGASRDALLASIDRFLALGRDPALLVRGPISYGVLEFWSLVYGYFIPFLYLSIFLGCFGRPDAERAEFLNGLALTYCLAYLGYLFIPSRGPVEYYAFEHVLSGGPLYAFVLRGVEMTGGNHGAFPSLHVGATAFLCAFDLRRNRLRGLTYLPFVGLIAVSTIVLRYHYVIDVIVGVSIAMAADRWASRLTGRREVAR